MMSSIVFIGENPIKTLVAATPEEQEVGLMWKKWPPPVLTFPFKSSETRSFWMKNTVSPLDIIFCNAGKVVAIMHGEPLSTKLISPGQPSDLVVELPAGTAGQLNISPGDPVVLKPTVSSTIT